MKNRLLLTVACFLQVLSCSMNPSAHRKQKADSNAFFFWYCLPDIFKKHLMSLVSIEHPNPNGEDVNSNNFDTSMTIPASTFSQLIINDLNWIERCMTCFDEKKGVCNLKSQTRLFFEALKEASASEIEKLFELAPEMTLKVLKRIPDVLLVKLLTNSLKSGEHIIRLLKLFERMSEFDLSEYRIMERIRKEAFRRDDYVLMNFTDEYPEVIKSSSMDQEGLINSIKADGFPFELWGIVSSQISSEGPIPVKTYDDFIKFKIFSHPVNTKNWTLLMFALATERYDLVRSLPPHLSYRPSSNAESFVPGTHITRIEHLLPLIPNRMIKEFIVQMYRLPKNLIQPSNPLFPSFKTLDQNGDEKIVQVLQEHERENVPFVSSRIYIDTEDITDKLFNRSVKEAYL